MFTEDNFPSGNSDFWVPHWFSEDLVFRGESLGTMAQQSDLGLSHGRYKTLEEKLNSFSSKHSKPSRDLELGRKAWSDVWDGHPVPWHTFFGDWPGNTSRKMHGIIVM
jgi:hypothetical protein